MTKVFFCRCSHANKKGEREGSSSFIVVVKGYSTILTYYPPLLPLELTLQCSPKKGERSLPIFQHTNTGLAPTTYIYQYTSLSYLINTRIAAKILYSITNNQLQPKISSPFIFPIERTDDRHPQSQQYFIVCIVRLVILNSAIVWKNCLKVNYLNTMQNSLDVSITAWIALIQGPLSRVFYCFRTYS